MKLLVVDDEAYVREAVQDALPSAEGWEVRGVDFGDVEAALHEWRPDLVVLDLIEGPGVGGSPSGNACFERIWATWFCPVVVYSAFSDKQNFQHPLVRGVEKGSGSERSVVACLEELRPLAEMMASVHAEFDQRIRDALRDSVPLLAGQLEDTTDSHLLARSVRRVVAARVDLSAGREEPLQAWERFVVPPLGDDLLTADLLRRMNATWADPTAFRLVLTPSCDLVAQAGATPRADSVLVACCGPVSLMDLFKSADHSAPTKRQRAKLKPLLSDGAAGRHIPIPGLQGHSPPMVADLKRLELLRWREIVPARHGATKSGRMSRRYERVASTDSPFREMVTWSFLKVAGRPGLPVVDVDAWSREIVESLGSEVA